MPDWKTTLNLPRTGFSMKANLQKTEPAMIARWRDMDLYGQLRAQRAGAPKFVLHDGPPYANGRIHIGTALNKILKDFIVKSQSMAGFDAPYVPGWDCHGLPIELKVDRELGPKKKQMSVGEFRRACRRYAAKYVDIQRADFERLGVLGLWSAPYLTMEPSYQAAIVRALGRFVEQGMVYKGRKPVQWCIHCHTALAEAEVEYEPHVSPSIFVEFEMSAPGAKDLGERIPEMRGQQVSALIWTTTPWTIPSNLALAFNPKLTYGAYRQGERLVILAADLAARVSQTVGRDLGQPVARFPGSQLEGLTFKHPLYERESLAVLGDYVTLEQGTGVVHTAPGHGSDDFHTGVRYGLEIYAPVGPAGHFADEVGLFGGLRVFDANPKIEEALAARDRLWHREPFEHAYPHCWRCHNPVIFLATWQWFISMDTEELRTRALDEIAKVEWFPSWGRERIHNMIANRPDWCISRQRSWGVPIPAVLCSACGDAQLTTALTERAAEIFEQDSADAWYERPIADFLPDGISCASCGGTDFERESDILDVWFDSGSSHEAVLAHRPELTWPADLYLEGSDQHRGWFHSSLLVGLGTRKAAPYRQVVTHGFVVTEDGRKMSKSLGNDIAPQAVIERSGAEILRLWVAMVDYREEARIGDEILSRVVEAYRKTRNTFRFLVSNLHDFDPTTDSLELDQLREVDRYALDRYATAALRMIQAYGRYDFQTVAHTLNTLVTVDLSAFYFDVSKDGLYTRGARSAERRSIQTAMYTIVDGLVRLAAPMLPVTAEELWGFLPARSDASVHLATFPDRLERFQDAGVAERWKALIAIRERVNKTLEEARQSKVVGTSLEADVQVTARGSDAELLERYRDLLPMLFIVSSTSVVALDGTDASGSDDASPRATVRRAEGVKCDRCWRYVPRVASEPDRLGLCDRCLDAVDSSRGVERTP